jgi:hypothetical protein
MTQNPKTKPFCSFGADRSGIVNFKIAFDFSGVRMSAHQTAASES